MDNHTACVIKAAMNAVDSLHLEFKKNGYNSLAKKKTEEYVRSRKDTFGLTEDEIIVILNHLDVICKCNW